MSHHYAQFGVYCPGCIAGLPPWDPAHLRGNLPAAPYRARLTLMHPGVRYGAHPDYSPCPCAACQARSAELAASRPWPQGDLAPILAEYEAVVEELAAFYATLPAPSPTLRQRISDWLLDPQKRTTNRKAR